jgi:hypothetical protein
MRAEASLKPTVSRQQISGDSQFLSSHNKLLQKQFNALLPHSRISRVISIRQPGAYLRFRM